MLEVTQGNGNGIRNIHASYAAVSFGGFQNQGCLAVWLGLWKGEIYIGAFFLLQDFQSLFVAPL